MSVPRSPHGSRPASNVLRLGSLLLVSSLLMGGAAVLAPSPARAASTSTLVQLMATDSLSFAPNSISVPTLSIEFEVENAGTVDHWFTISSRVNQTAPSDTNASLTSAGSYFASNEVLADQALNHGTTFFVNVTFPTAGSYEFICRYHFPSMIGELHVGVPASSGSTATSLLVYGAIGVVVVLALVVVAVVVMRRRPPAAAAPAPAK